MYDDPPQCPTCGQPKTKVYCTSVPDSSVQLLLKQRGLGKYAGPVHRIDVVRDTDNSLEEELLACFMEPIDPDRPAVNIYGFVI